MAIVIRTNGLVETIKGKNGDGSLTLKQMQEAVGGYIEHVVQPDNEIEIYADGEGLIKHRECNTEVFYKYGLNLVGDVLVCKKGEVK